MILALSTSGNPFTNARSANPAMVLTAIFADHINMSYLARNMELGAPLFSTINRFERFTRNAHNIPDLAVLGNVSSNGVFLVPQYSLPFERGEFTPALAHLPHRA